MLLLLSRGKVGSSGATSFHVVSPLLVSGTSKGAVCCCGMSVGHGSRVGMVAGAVSLGDGVGLSCRGSDRVSGVVGHWSSSSKV